MFAFVCVMCFLRCSCVLLFSFPFYASLFIVLCSWCVSMSSVIIRSMCSCLVSFFLCVPFYHVSVYSCCVLVACVCVFLSK